MSIRMGHNIRLRTVRAVAVIAVAATAFIGIGQPAHAKGATLLADTFSGGGLNLGNWTYLLGEYPTNSQIYLPTEVLVDGGGLHLHAEQPKPFTVNLAGGIESQQSFLYGEFHVVARLPKDDGLWPAAWLSAQKNGEIDIFEAFGSHTTRFQTTVHDWNNGSEDGPQCIQVGWKVQPVNGVGSRCSSWIPLDKHGQPIDWHADFHDWGMLWTPSGTSFTMDGHPYWSTSWSPSVPMKLVLNVGVGTYWDGYPDGTDVWPASMDIRSVTVNALQ
jgi:beta-glucanase (GH16 family)